MYKLLIFFGQFASPKRFVFQANITHINHHSLAYKRQAQPNKTYQGLQQKQKSKISDWMYQTVSEYYREHCEMPESEAVEQITARIYDKIKSLAIWVPYDEVHRVFLLKLPRFEERITADRMTETEQTPPKRNLCQPPLRKRETATRSARIAAGK